MSIKSYSDYRPPLFTHTLKEKLKDVKNFAKFNAIDSEYIFIHVAKAGGNYLKSILSRHVDIDVAYSHEKKLIHFSRNQNLIVSLRDPVSRFESAFYSDLHKHKLLSKQRKVFYDKYSDVNDYVSDLAKSPASTLDFAWRNSAVAMVGRFSTLYYWLNSTNVVRRKAGQICAVIRAEHMQNDLLHFFESLDISLDSNEFEETPMKAKPVNTFPPLNQNNMKFLKRFFSAEYEIANLLLALKGKPPYQ